MSLIQETRNQPLLECITRGLEASFGEDVKQVIFFQFKERMNLSLEDIPRRPDAFELFLNGFFGERGSIVVQKAIVAEIKKNFSIKLSNPASIKAAIRAAAAN